MMLRNCFVWVRVLGIIALCLTCNISFTDSSDTVIVLVLMSAFVLAIAITVDFVTRPRGAASVGGIPR